MSAQHRTPTAPAQAAALLDAGAVLPAGTTDREDADALTVRTYTHPALGDRPVVRLVPGTLGEAEDLALDFLGLAREAEAPEVGQVRRETLGFPAWALVNDPANGHHALALVKDVERLSRQAKSRAGAAKQGFEELGRRLGRAVPHFLPTFYEQAARVFLQHENTTYAATFFGKARDAERVHGLTVDEERLRAVFLEFAFAGALTVKALKEYVKDLAGRLDPADAWAQFRKLAVERCAAGMPPYASLPQDARALVKAAGLHRPTEEAAFVADLLASPAVVRAPRSFWTAYRPVLVAVAADRPEVRHRLLEIMPSELNGSTEDHAWWLDLLADTGAAALLTGEAAGRHGEAGEPAGRAAVDAADWLSRWAAHRKRGGGLAHRCAATLALVQRMAPRLRADGKPVDLFSGRWRSSAEPDLLDLCTAQRIPVTAPEPDTHLPLGAWLRDTRPGRRDLAATGADSRLRALLHRAVGDLGGDPTLPQVLDALAGHPVLGGVLSDWLDEATAALTAARGLPAARAALGRLRPFRTAAPKVNPAAVARIAAHRAAPLLGRTLRAGILDELGWPVLDEAVERLRTETKGKDKDGDATTTVTEAWPALIVARRDKVLVVGPDRILLEHELRIPGPPDRWRRPHFRYTDGELLVVWWEDGKQLGYWTARPGEVLTVGGEQLPRWWHAGAGEPSIPLPGGGRATGGRTLHAGDTVLPPGRPVLGDGTAYWRQSRKDGRATWVEYDPATGTDGRASLPAFLRSAVRDDARLVQEHCEVLPLQPGLENSPFGTDGTVLGRWIRKEGEGTGATLTAGTPDGRTVTLGTPHGRVHATPLGALRMPGGAAPSAVLQHRSVCLYEADDTSTAGELGQVTPGDRGSDFVAGTRLVPPVAFWHALRPRDETGSLALRALTDPQAEALLASTAHALDERAKEARATKEYQGPSADDVARRTVSRALPALTDERLLTGVTALVRAAVRHAAATAEFTAPPKAPAPAHRPAQDMFADYSPPHGDDDSLHAATDGLTGPTYHTWSNTTRWNALRQIRAVNHVLSGRPAAGRPLPDPEQLTALDGGWRSDDRTVPRIGVGWLPVLPALRAIAYRAALPGIRAGAREALLLLLDAVGEGPLADPRGAVREAVLSEEHREQQRAGQVLRLGDRTVVVLGRLAADRGPGGRVRWLALDHDPHGTFGAIAHFTLEQETDRTPDLPADRLTAVTRLVRAKGPAPWRTDAPAALAAATRYGAGPYQSALLLAAGGECLSGDAPPAHGLKPRQKELAARLLDTLAPGDRAALVGALLPEDPADLWTNGPDTDAAGRVWDERLGSRLRLPEDLAARLTDVAPDAVEAVLNPQLTPWLSRTTVQRIDRDGHFAADDPEAVPRTSALDSAVHALTALAYEVPYAHPLRAALPAGLAALRHRLTDPGLILDLGLTWADKGGPAAEQVRSAYGLPAAGAHTAPPTAGTDADQGLTRAGEALVLRVTYGGTEGVMLRPAGLTGADDPALGLLEGLLGPTRSSVVHAVRDLLSGALVPVAEAGTDPEGPAGHPHDPEVGVPDLVTEVAAVHGLSRDAAVLYLQILALPDPTDRNCAHWTGWKPARIKKARTELAASPLVVEAKRARAGRGLFLPCGWLDAPALRLPLETWKEGLYPVRHGRRVALGTTVPDLFARAWERVRVGDAPAYEELTTRATRKGRRR
ncbi:hypothetical protein [Streptomyces sp. CC210A]|uniref:hypothetical protein n=1 Tax=Streptomyces sp. CC210A TaxID=2898184 RepID=UPI001F39A81A|nr:hypothetical protein [Streptomyces sp. CC210A]